MKKKILVPTLLLFFLFLTTIIYVISCKKNDSSSVNVNTSKEYVLVEKGLLDDNMYLPAGTKWRYTSVSGSEVKFTLPEGYSFLIKDESNGTYKIDPGGGGYSCTCSKGGSCKVFYQDKLGYGCLQNDCTGSCTGTPTANAQKIVGVLNIKNNEIDRAKKTTDYASLSEEGKTAFFQLPEVKKEIEKIYNSLYKDIYKDIYKPDFDKIDPNNLPSNYVIVKHQLYGYTFGLLYPNDTQLFRYLPELKADVAAPKSCTCSGTQGGDNCALHKDCIGWYCAYSCSGCTTCTMNN